MATRADVVHCSTHGLLGIHCSSSAEFCHIPICSTLWGVFITELLTSRGARSNRSIPDWAIWLVTHSYFRIAVLECCLYGYTRSMYLKSGLRRGWSSDSNTLPTSNSTYLYSFRSCFGNCLFFQNCHVPCRIRLFGRRRLAPWNGYRTRFLRSCCCALDHHS